MKRLNTEWRVMSVSVLSLGGPDLVDSIGHLFLRLGPVFEGLLRIGQVGVAIGTIYYIFLKCKAVKRRRRSK